MEEKKEERSLNQRLMDAMAEMENPKKEKSGYNYKYETLEQVLGIVRPALSSNGLMLTQGQRYDEQSGGWVLETAVFDGSERVIMDSRKIEEYSDAQKAGSWETYMRRYALRTAFGLTGEDDDGAATKGVSKQNPTAKRNTAASGDIFKGAKVTEMASDELMEKIDFKIDDLAKIRGVSFDDVKDALMKSKTMKGVKGYEQMTNEQANNALCLLVQWEGKADTKGEYYDEDVDF